MQTELQAMNTAERIYQEAKKLPEAAAREVLDFVEYLKAKYRRKFNDIDPNLQTIILKY